VTEGYSYMKPGQYRVPASLRITEAWRATWAAAPFLAIVLFGTIWVGFHNGWGTGGAAAMYLLLAITLGVIGWGVFHTWVISGAVRYEVEGITVVFGDEDYYVPPEVFVDFLERHVWGKFQLLFDRTPADVMPLDKMGVNPRDLTDGVLVICEGDEPLARVREGDGSVRIKNVLGATQPWRRYSRIAARGLLDPGVGGYELKLHCCHKLFPGRQEADDIAWMQEHDIA